MKKNFAKIFKCFRAILACALAQHELEPDDFPAPPTLAEAQVIAMNITTRFCYYGGLVFVVFVHNALLATEAKDQTPFSLRGRTVALVTKRSSTGRPYTPPAGPTYSLDHTRERYSSGNNQVKKWNVTFFSTVPRSSGLGFPNLTKLVSTAWSVPRHCAPPTGRD